MLFDTFQRYLEVYRLVSREAALKPDHTIRLLDIGSNGPGFADFNKFPNVDQTNIDISPPDPKVLAAYPHIGFVTYPGDELPFDDESFDIVVCVDVLEHVPPEKRAKFIHEGIRVSRRHIVFVFPVRSSAPWEQVLSKMTFGKIKFLEEHIRHGLPSENDFYEAIQPITTAKLIHESGNMNIGLWIPLKLASSLSLRLFKRFPGLIFQSFLLYGSFFARWVNWGQCYSKTFILEKQQHSFDSLGSPSER